MKNIISFIFLIYVLTPLLSQKNYNSSEVLRKKTPTGYLILDKKDNQPVTGIVNEHYKNKIIKHSYSVQNGLFEGVSNYFLKSGQVRIQSNWKKGLPISYKWYYKSGQPWWEEYYKDGLKDSIYKSWYKTGQLESEGNYIKNKKEGLWKSYYSDGKVESEKYYIKGERLKMYNSEKTNYYFDDEHDTVYLLKNKVPITGFIFEKNKYGGLKFKAMFINGKLNGISQEWCDNGQLESEEYYIDGVLNGIKRYECSGKLMGEAVLTNGNGFLKLNYWTGTSSITEYKNGKQVFIKCFDANGVEKPCDGKVYKSVVIGTQTWMDENLNVSTFRNGDPIPEAKTNTEWEKAGKEGKPAWCYYDNDPKNGEIYGRLYNWYAVNDPRGLAPIGYHIPSYDEWMVLREFLGGLYVAGNKMKNVSGWRDNSNGSNESGFSGLPGGMCNWAGSFIVNGYAYWWSTTINTNNNLFAIYLDYHNKSADTTTCDKEDGLSVRCIKD